jgi:hypothetical protein
MLPVSVLVVGVDLEGSDHLLHLLLELGGIRAFGLPNVVEFGVKMHVTMTPFTGDAG